MNAHVDQERHVMFQQSADEADRRLIEMVRDARETMSDRMDEVFVAMRRDYRSVLGGGDSQGEVLPKPQRLLRKEVMTTLDEVEKLFKVALGQATDDDWEAEGDMKNLKDCEESQDLDAEAASFQDSTADDLAARQLKSEQGERNDVPMHDTPGSVTWTGDHLLPHDQFIAEGKFQASSNNLSTSTGHKPVMIEPSDVHRGDGLHPSMLGYTEPQDREASNSDQEDFESTGTHEDDHANLPIEPEQDDEMDTFDSFPSSDH